MTDQHSLAQPEAPPEAVALMRMVDFRIPLPWLIGGFGVALWAAISMYFELKQVSQTLAQVQIEVKAGNSSYAALAGEVALLKFRLDGLEADRRAVPAGAAGRPR